MKLICSFSPITAMTDLSAHPRTGVQRVDNGKKRTWMCSTGGSVSPLLLFTMIEKVMDWAADGILIHRLTEPAPPLTAISIRAYGVYWWYFANCILQCSIKFWFAWTGHEVRHGNMLHYMKLCTFSHRKIKVEFNVAEMLPKFPKRQLQEEEKKQVAFS